MKKKIIAMLLSVAMLAVMVIPALSAATVTPSNTTGVISIPTINSSSLLTSNEEILGYTAALKAEVGTTSMAQAVTNHFYSQGGVVGSSYRVSATKYYGGTTTNITSFTSPITMSMPNSYHSYGSYTFKVVAVIEDDGYTRFYHGSTNTTITFNVYKPSVIVNFATNANLADGYMSYYAGGNGNPGGGYYDSNGNWIPYYSGGGYYDSNGNWVPYNGGGYYDSNGIWRPYNNGGWIDADGNWHYGDYVYQNTHDEYVRIYGHVCAYGHTCDSNTHYCPYGHVCKYYARYGNAATPSKVTVQFQTNGGYTMNNAVVNYGDTIDWGVYRTTRAGFEFGGWYFDSNLTQRCTSDTQIKADTTLYARWLPLEVAPVTPEQPTTPPITSNPQTGDSWFANLFF